MKKIILGLIVIIGGTFSSYAADDNFNNSYKIELNNFPEETVQQIIESVNKEKSLEEAIEKFYNLKFVSHAFNNIIKNQFVQKLFIINCVNKFGEQAFKKLFDRLAEDLDKNLSKIKFLLRNHNLLEKRFLNLDINSSVSKALMYAVKNDCNELLEILINSGINVDIKYCSEMTALMVACSHGKSEIAKMLIKAGADFEAQSDSQLNGLIRACYMGHVKLVKMLIKIGANVNILDNSGRTALIYACRKGHLEIVKMLIEAGANINILDNSGRTALDYAKTVEIKEVLLLKRDNN